MSRWTHDRLKAEPWNFDVRVSGWIENKLDGYRLTYFKDKGEVYAFGRDTSDRLEMLQRFPRLRNTVPYHYLLKCPDGTSIDCEAYGNGPASEVPTLLRSESEPLNIATFAIPFFGFSSQMFAEIEEVRKAHSDLPWVPGMTVKEVDPSELLDLAEASEIEGYIVKKNHYRGWYKLKHTRSVDCIITGWTLGNGKYVGSLGSVECSVWKNNRLQPICDASGMSDAMRAMLYELANGMKLEGLVCEIAYQYVGTGGRLRHPRFIRLRDDKPANECTYAQLGVP